MRQTIRWGAFLFALILSFVAGKPASAICMDNAGLALVTIDGDATCAYSGGGCSSCFTKGGRGGDSWDLCYYDWATNDADCTYYL
jgi:hypothetical protein